MQFLRSRLTRGRESVADRWLLISPIARGQLRFVLGFCVALFTFHYLWFTFAQPFYIEDSAISFAYSRNLVAGEGLVPFAGGERVEGYSNALWTFVIAGCYALGLNVWTASKLLGWAFGVVTLFASWGLVRQARADSPDHWSAWLAPLLLACSTQFVLWCSSGLENALFCMLLALGTWSLVREVDDGGGAPWSALCFFGLTMTRPDGIAYAGIAVFARLAASGIHRQWLASIAWLAVFGVFYGGYNAWRYDYFASWWPNTYYAKTKDFRPFAWTGAGWKMVKDWFTLYGVVYAAPLLAMGVAGWRGWRRWFVVLLVALLALFLLWDGQAQRLWSTELTRWIGREWADWRVWYLLGGSSVLGLLVFGRAGWLPRGMLWAFACTGVFFVVWSSGDWMKGFRWFSLTSVPIFTLLAIGAGELIDALPLSGFAWRGVVGRGVYAFAGLVALAVPSAIQSTKLVQDAETQTRDVRKRVNYMRWVQRRLFIEHVTLLDVDMGAHMYFSDWWILDGAGLIDVPVALRKWQKSFGEDYVFNGYRPDFAHQHASWARTMKLTVHPRWKDEYVEIPGFPSGKRSLHVGNWVRKDHLVGRAYDGPPGRSVAFADGITLEGWEVPAPEVAPGGRVYVSTTWRAARRAEGFRVIVFLADAAGNLHSAEVAPGYDWYAPPRWEPHEYVYGRWAVQLPDTLPEGTYDLGFVIIDQGTGAVLAHQPVGGVEVAPGETVAAASAATPRYMTGEWRAPAVVRVVSAAEARAAAEADRDEALRLAAAGDCDGAREAGRDASRHVATSTGWIASTDRAIEPVVIDCLVRRAGQETNPVAAAKILREARKIDHRHAGLVAAGRDLARRLDAAGDAARDAEDWEAAFDAYEGAVHVDPSLSWTRRKAEEARDKRLGISGKEPERAKPRAR